MFKLDTILGLTKCKDGDEIPYFYLETNVDENDSSLNRIGVKVDKFVVKFNEEYDEHNIYRQFLNKLDTLDILKINLVIDNKDADNIKSRKIVNNIHRLSNLIAGNGRIGPLNFIIATSKYEEIIKQLGYQNCNINIDESLGDKIIVGRKNEIDSPGIQCFYDDNNMCIVEYCPTTYLQYGILKIKYV
jgi:hypothetical protein